MDDVIAKLQTPESCERYALNVEPRSPERALAARRRAIELRAAKHGANSDAEREALEAVYAYERVLSGTHGRKTRASRTWQMIERHGIIEAVERVVSRKAESAGYHALVDFGLQDKAFEAVVLRHREVFSAQAVARSEARLRDWIAAADCPAVQSWRPVEEPAVPCCCPRCGGKRLARIMYGLVPKPDEELERELREGQVVLGGCCAWDRMPQWKCTTCAHEWRVDIA